MEILDRLLFGKYTHNIYKRCKYTGKLTFVKKVRLGYDSYSTKYIILNYIERGYTVKKINARGKS